MSRMSLKLALAGLATASIAAVGMSGTAQAAPAAPAKAMAPAAPSAVAAADGYFYAWIDSNFNNNSCRWSGNASDWGACKNRASSVQNNGYVDTYDDVNMYWGTGYTGAWYCLARGHYLRDMRYDYFNRGSNKAGYGESMGDNVASHKWATSC